MDIKTVNPSETETFSAGLSLPLNINGAYDQAGYYACVYLWDSNTFVPVTQRYLFPAD
jgi:hypothetical protein